MQDVLECPFERMNTLAESHQPFFFLTNFVGTEVKLFTEKDLQNQTSVQFSFPTKQLCVSPKESTTQFHWKAFPESIESFEKGFHIIMNGLKRGNSYLANYTRKTKIETDLTLQTIFNQAQAKYKVFFNDQFVCFSPETFIEIKNHRITTHPMKGTIDADLPNAAEILRNDIKEKAEHYTVVDLLRNDLSMVANNVQVDEFQRLDYIKTREKNLFGMSSEISGDVKPMFKNKIGTILQKLLPAGSILGAPKPKTLEMVLEAEGYDRGFYTGIAGWFDGENLDSCVMIRFIEQENKQFYFKSGGGITHMSKLEDEYNEMKNKIYVPIH